MKVDKNGRLISNGYIAELIQKGFSIGEYEKGLFVRLPINQFTRDFLKPTMSLPYKIYPQELAINSFRKIQNLLQKFGISQEYEVAFSILIHATQQALRQNKINRSKKYELITQLQNRFSEYELPKSVTVRYSQKESYSLPLDLIIDFWQAFVFNVKNHPQSEKIIPVEAELFKIVSQLTHLKRQIQDQLIAEILSLVMGEKSTYTPDKIRKRRERQSGQKRKKGQ